MLSTIKNNVLIGMTDSRLALPTYMFSSMLVTPTQYWIQYPELSMVGVGGSALVLQYLEHNMNPKFQPLMRGICLLSAVGIAGHKIKRFFTEPLRLPITNSPTYWDIRLSATAFNDFYTDQVPTRIVPDFSALTLLNELSNHLTPERLNQLYNRISSTRVEGLFFYDSSGGLLFLRLENYDPHFVISFNMSGISDYKSPSN